MSHTVTPPLANDFMQVWYSRMVDLCNIMTTEVLTVNASAIGAFTSGNGFNTGIFGSTVLVANTIQGGTVNTAGPLNVNSNMVFINTASLSVGSNLVINSTSVQIGNSNSNTFINSSSVSIGGTVLNAAVIASITSGSNINVNTAGTSSQVIDTFLKSASRAATYNLQVTDNTANAYQISSLSMIWDGTNVLITEYGQLFTNNQIGIFNASTNATSINLLFTPGSTATTVKGYKSILAL